MFEWELSPKTLLGVGGIAGVLLVYLAIPFVNRGGEIVEIRGTVVAPFEQPSDDGGSYYLRVALESGNEVAVPISRTFTVRPGREVVLSARKRGGAGLSGYHFERYADTDR